MSNLFNYSIIKIRKNWFIEKRLLASYDKLSIELFTEYGLIFYKYFHKIIFDFA